MFTKVLKFYEEHKKFGPLAFFLGGFFLDVFTLGRADDLFTNLQLSAFLFVSAVLIFLEVLVLNEQMKPRGFWAKVWKFHIEATQFILGGLFSAYTVFYFQSASIRASFAFMIVLIAIMLVNEFIDFGFRGLGARMLFFSYCLISFFIYLVPVVFGGVGPLYFLLALVISTLVYWAYYSFIKKQLNITRPVLLRKVFRLPFYGVLLFFLVTYYSKVIPPVPLSVSYIGVFHNVEKKAGEYKLSYSRPYWKFWEKGAQSFEAFPGDRIYCFVSIFSPVDFEDQVFVRWSFKNAQGHWEKSDAIPISIQGGRGEGYRGYTYKQNYQDGDWRIEIETEDERELGRIYLTVHKNTEMANASREWETIIK